MSYNECWGYKTTTTPPPFWGGVEEREQLSQRVSFSKRSGVCGSKKVHEVLRLVHI